MWADSRSVSPRWSSGDSSAIADQRQAREPARLLERRHAVAAPLQAPYAPAGRAPPAAAAGRRR